MKFYSLSISLLTMLVLLSCHHSNENSSAHSTDNVPVLSPKESMEKMNITNGFEVKLVASEPLISTPVSMTMDDDGRIWIVEMTDYDPIKDDSSHFYPLGEIAILEDTDGDGKMDKRKLFMDSLALPRSICLTGGGILIADPPHLWYVKIRNDKPGKKILVDSAYTVSYNIEGQTNGLLEGIDNWIYSVGFGSSKRYRQINGKWVTQKTFLRGQWGMTQDNYGHLFYNNNSQNLLGDYFLPGVTHGNKYLKNTAGFNEKIVPDNKVYPLIATPGVNRGYREGVLDSTGRLVHFTAACGPLIYRNKLFPKAYWGNAFVCEPAAYLIKRNIIERDGLKITGKQAWQEKEFLASSDRRFRPVSLYNGSDGSIYVVDMYRGVIQDDLSLTDYLKNYSLEHGLNVPISCGRIYKIVPRGSKTSIKIIPDNPQKLVKFLGNKNAWVRDHAQQKIIDDKYKQLIPQLRDILSSNQSVITKIHALWTLEGLEALRKEDILRLLKSGNNHLQAQALTALISLLNGDNYQAYLPKLKQVIARKDAFVAPYLTYAVGRIFKISPSTAIPLWKELLKHYSDNQYVVDAIISSIQKDEEQFDERFKFSELFQQRLKTAIENKDHPENKKKLKALTKKYPEGYAVFSGFCQTCHGMDGNGIKYVAPPLNGSEWVVGDKKHLVPIVSYGLTGPVKVKGKVYKKPTITGDMPAVGGIYSDTALAEVLSFIRQAWNNNASEVSIKDIQKIRKKYRGRTQSFTIKELLGEKR